MRLGKWRRINELTQEQLAERLGSSQPYISTLERRCNPVIPARELMIRIYILTGGEVEPNDFYDLPDLNQAQLALNAGPCPLLDGAGDSQSAESAEAA